jgi:hypothetical protein
MATDSEEQTTAQDPGEERTAQPPQPDRPVPDPDPGAPGAGEEDDDPFSHLDLTPEEEERLGAVAEEFGEDQITEIMADAAISEHFSQFLLDAYPRMKEVMERQSGKADFYLHREMRSGEDEFYVLRSPTPSEFQTQWTALLNPQLEEDEHDKIVIQLLSEVMLYPEYGEVDWDYSGDGMYAPKGLTKNRLNNVFWKYEVQGRDEPTDTSFSEDAVEDAVTVAKRSVEDEKPSL